MRKIKYAVGIITGLAVLLAAAFAYWLAKINGLVHIGPDGQEL